MKAASRTSLRSGSLIARDQRVCQFHHQFVNFTIIMSVSPLLCQFHLTPLFKKKKIKKMNGIEIKCVGHTFCQINTFQFSILSVNNFTTVLMKKIIYFLLI